jgi:hypothetical protein
MVHVWDHWTAGAVPEAIADPCLGSCFSRSDVLRCIHIGLLCIQEDPADRPVMSMSSVVMMPGSDTVSLWNPSNPAFYARNRPPATSS